MPHTLYHPPFRSHKDQPLQQSKDIKDARHAVQYSTVRLVLYAKQRAR